MAGTDGRPECRQPHPSYGDAEHDLQEQLHGIEIGRPLNDRQHVVDRVIYLLQDEKAGDRSRKKVSDNSSILVGSLTEENGRY